MLLSIFVNFIAMQIYYRIYARFVRNYILELCTTLHLVLLLVQVYEQTTNSFDDLSDIAT